jgi:hypothetical protein
MEDKREFDNPYEDFVPHRENSAFNFKDGKVRAITLTKIQFIVKNRACNWRKIRLTVLYCMTFCYV